MEGESTGGTVRRNREGDALERNAEQSERTIPVRVLRRAAAEGIITTAQLDALLTFVAKDDATAETSREARRGLNAVTVAYWGGALAVLFALGWFLVDRWRGLGAGGVLAVSVGYAIVFALVAWKLARSGFERAAAFSTLLVVGMVPVMTWAVMALAGVWPDVPRVYSPQLPSGGYSPRELTRWIPIDVATLVASLIALRFVRFDVLALPAAISWAYLPFHVMPAITGVPISWELEGFTALAVGTSLLTVGYLVEQRQRGGSDGDYASWIYLVGLGAMVAAGTQIWDKHRAITPHVVLAFAIASVAIALRLRRRSFLAAGAIGFVGYLGWLAFDVFRRTLGFPIVLAGFGLSIILLAVWLQRRFPALTSRMGSDRLAGRRSLPGGVVPFAASFVVALVLLILEMPAARSRYELRVQREKESLAKIRADSARPAPR